MRKKGPRQIPDFSSKKSIPGTPKVDPKAHLPSNIPAPLPKPKATSSKSGRRGQ